MSLRSRARFLFVIFACFAAPSAVADPGFAALGNLGLVPTSVPTVTYLGWITPEQVPGDVEQQRLAVQVPLHRDQKDSVSLSVGGSSLHFGNPSTLSETGIGVPQDLWKVEVGGSYSRQLGEGKLVGGSLSIGSASDHPFSVLDVTTVGMSAYYGWSASEKSRWMLTLFFSNNNPIVNYVPIPGFIYLVEDRHFIGMFGFPFNSLIWMPQDPWMFTLSIFGPTINSEIAYGSPKKVQAFAGFSWVQQSYLRQNRPETNDRLYYDEKHVPLGVRFPVGRGLRTEFSVGYSFDRSVYEGPHFRSKDDGSASLGSSWYAAWNFRMEI